MKSLDREVTVTGRAGAGSTYADRETPRRTEVAHEEKKTAEKPRLSEEIAIEEINIDGMCGVY